MKKVLLKFYNKNNLGDDLFVKIITERFENPFSIQTEIGNKLFDNITNLHVHKNSWLQFVYRLFGKLRKQGDVWLYQLSKKNDLLVHIGGSLFIEGPSSGGYWRRQSDFYRRLAIPYYIVGSNYGPQLTEEFFGIVNDIFKNAKDVCFREHASYELFKSLPHIRVATDIAFSLDTSKYGVKNDKNAIISLVDTSSRFNKTTADNYEKEIVVLTQKLINEGYKIIIMSFCKSEGDEIASKSILSQLNEEITQNVQIYNYNGDLERALSLIAQCDIMIGTRFHAVILGLLFSKKTLPFAYSDKTINILKDMNFEGPVIDIRDMSSFDGASFDFNSLKVNNIEKQIELAELQFQELDKVLAKRK